MTTALTELEPGRVGRLVRVVGDNGMSQRLMALGLTPGTVVRVERVAPLGDPIEIRVRGYSLMLRRSEAAQIIVRWD